MRAIAAGPGDRAAWLAWRRQGIGASDAAAIAGLDPFRSALSVWLDKTGRLPDELEDPEYRRWGNLLEPAIMDEFEVRSGLFAVDRGIWRFRSDLTWMRATIDALVAEVPFRRRGRPHRSVGGPETRTPVPLGVLEVKTVAGFKGRDWLEGVPEHFQLQVQHQLAVTGLSHAWLAVLFGGQRLHLVELERDDELVAELVELEEAFWTKHVLADVAPASDGSIATSEALRRAFAAGGGGEVELPAGVEEVIAQRAAGKATEKEGERVALEAEQSLMAMLGEAEVGLVAGRPRVTWKRQDRREYTVKASTQRVLRIVGKAGEEEES